MPRFFTLMQAEEVLPDVESLLREAIALRASASEAEQELQFANQRIMMLGGSMVNRDRLMERKNQRSEDTARLKQALDRIQSHGCVVKDLDTGLLDFPTRYHGNEVYLCWKLGESGIGFWHGVSEGFRGRKRIDAEFLSQHQGDLPS